MRLKKFLAGEFDADLIVVENATNSAQNFLSYEEFQICRELLGQEQETLLNLLLPDVGIARKHRIETSLSTVRKLCKIGVIDPEEVFGVKKIDNTIEERQKKQIFHISSFSVFSTALIGFFEKIFSVLGTFPFFLFVIGTAGLTIGFFPFMEVNSDSINDGFSYLKMFLSMYLVISFALSFRTIIQAGFLKTQNGESRNNRIDLLGIFPFLRADLSSINLCGARDKSTMAILGIISPLSFAALFVFAHRMQMLSFSDTYICTAACVGLSLFLACPFFSNDGADFLGGLLLRRSLTKNLARELQRSLGRKKINASLIVAMFLSVIWLVVWVYGTRQFLESLALIIADDLNADSFLGHVGAFLTIALFLGILAAPAFYFGLSMVTNKRRDVKGRGPLSFEEQIAALQRTPMFSILNDKERLNLFNQMELAVFDNGQELVRQGEIGTEFLVVVRGNANVIYTDPSGQEFILSTITTGDAFGEIALIDDVPRTASVVAINQCHALILQKADFAEFVNTIGSPERAKQMIRLSSFIRRHPLFNKLDAKSQADLIDTLQFRTVMPGEQIQAKLDGHDCFNIVYSGFVSVDSDDDNAYARLEQDDCFGYANPMGYKFAADGGVGLLTIKIHEFHELVWNRFTAHPELLLKVEK